MSGVGRDGAIHMVWAARLRWAAQRVLQIVPVIIVATFLVFGMLQLVPGDPAVTLAGDSATPQRIEQIRALYGLDRPFLAQYGTWLLHAAHGDLSRSILSGEPVRVAIMDRLPNTLLIVAGSLTLSLVIGIPMGVAAATRAGTRIDGAITGLTSFGVAVPSFWLAMLLVSVFALGLHWFPATGAVGIGDDFAGAVRHAVLPSIALCASGVATVARQLRSALVDVLSSQYVRTLQAKGLSPASILWKHGLKNVSVPLLTVIGLLVNRLLGATVVIEAVFAIPGTGSLVVNAALGKDFPVVQGVVLTMVIMVVVTNLLVDALYTVLDPRVSRS
ncbi:MAG TPA: ABC transporter permease [Stellaceae bacterium]|nr:ABC transporter permease [Stellaceae bacterium]